MNKYNRLIGFGLIVGTMSVVAMAAGVKPPAQTTAAMATPVAGATQDDLDLYAYEEKKKRACAPRGAEMAQVLGLTIERQTTAMVSFNTSGAIRTMTYGCPSFGDDPGSFFVSWDGGLQPPPRVMALIVEAAHQLTADAAEPVMRAVTVCLKKAARSDMSEEIALVATEISCSTVNGAGERSGTVNISRLRSKSED